MRIGSAVLWLAFVAAWVVPAVVRAQTTPAASRPNVLFIISDDCGYHDFGFQGSKEIRTPNLDALAQGGVRFTNAYVTAPICGASRAGLITGRYHERHSFDGTPPPGGGLAVNEMTIAEALKGAGYDTALVGKWSLGDSANFHPMKRGFDQFFGFTGQLHPYIPGPVTRGLEMVMSEAPRPGWGAPVPAAGRGGGLISSGGAGGGAGKFLRGNTVVDEPEHATDAFTREALAFLRAKHEHPYFLYLSYNASHSPLQPPQKYIDQYPNLTGKRQLYAATTTHMDESIGKVIAAVRELKQEESTLIIFMNDNGGARDDITADNSPLSGSKFQLWEGGIRVPFFFYWKGRFAAGATVQQPMISLDLFPTLLAAAGLPTPAGKELEGINLMPVLTSGKDDATQMDRAMYWRYTQQTAIRKGKWKLARPQAQVAEPLLFDLSTDVGENKNVAAENPEVVKELIGLWEKWNEKNMPMGAGAGRAGAGRAGVAPGRAGGRGAAPADE